MSYTTASSRYGVREAPVGLSLVQDFVNTRAVNGHLDLFADGDTASSWAHSAVERWPTDRGADAPGLTLSATDVRHLRELRTTFELLLDDPTYKSPGRGMDQHDWPDGNAIAVPVAAKLVPDAGDVMLVPTGSGWRWLASALWIETYRSQQNGTWSRLKRCRNTECGLTFYDSSRNNSGVWHDVRTCGNIANLRASRERRRRWTTQAPKP
jgi:predicted RNA-binding Zn ribbon-like protein